MTKNGCSLSTVVSYTIGNAMERRFRKVKINFDLSHPLPAPLKNWSWTQTLAKITQPTQKFVPGPKMTKNVCSLIIVMSYTTVKPMERRFPKDQEVLTCSIYFLPCPKIGHRRKMTQNVPEPKMPQNGYFSSMVIPLLLESPWQADLKWVLFRFCPN